MSDRVCEGMRDLLLEVKAANKKHGMHLEVEAYPRLRKDAVRWCVVVIDDDECEEVATGSDLAVGEAAATCLQRLRRFIRKELVASE